MTIILVLLWYWLVWAVAVVVFLTVLVIVGLAVGTASGVCHVARLRRASRYLWRIVESIADLGDSICAS